MMNFEEFEDYLMHEGRSIDDGAPIGSGRYPKGSGENPYQHDGSFIGTVKKLREQGLSDKEIYESFGMNSSQFRAKLSIEKNAKRASDISRARILMDHGYGYTEIGRQMGVPESTVRSWLDPTIKERALKTTNVANSLKEAVAKKKYVDVGAGTENYMGISRQRLKTAIAQLKEEGYQTGEVWIEQLGTGKKTDILVLYGPDTTYQEVQNHKGDIKLVTDYTEDMGRTMQNIEPPRDISSSRVMIRYAEDGGKDKDGVIELRRGVEDLNLGKASYAQVRIAVDGSHYLKGMAIYGDDMPKGVDVIFNTNKHRGTPMLGEKDNSVLKPLKRDKTTGEIDLDNPFGSTIKNEEQLRYIQKHYIDKNGEKQLSALNIVNEQGTWEGWSKTLSSQFLSKQSPELAKKQLDLAYKQKLAEFDSYNSLTNPTVKKYFLDRFADSCDSDAVSLKAAALPRQSNSVILPVNSLKDTEVYAPNYRNGEEVILVRHPHAGTFEIPKLRVNNNNKEGKRIIGNSPDAIGINPKVAEKLSGADFDGDSVIIIPTQGQKLKVSPSLKGLDGFDPKEAYPGYPGMPKMKSKTKQTEMGKISNLITDMTLKGASQDELARAVRHSMVVIDAEKHNLNWKQSYSDNNIAELKEKYQGGKDRGASTLISRAKHEERIPERKQLYSNGGIDPKTGKKVYINTDRSYEKSKKIKDKNGNYIYDENGNIKREYKTGKYEQATTKIFSMARVDDAYELSSGTKIENVYADHANKLKALANQARKLYLSTPKLKQNASAKKTYSKEVSDLESKLRIALRNAPLERQAQLIAGKIVAEEKKHNPDIRGDKDALKKARTRAIIFARDKAVGTKRTKISLTDREWEAIQAGAISDSKLSEILRFADPDEIKKRATPKNNYISVSPAALSMARSWLNAGFTQSEVANELGISVSTLSKALKEGV